MICCEINFGSEAYLASLALRERCLRRPLGLTLSDADLEGEDGQWHYGLFDDGALVACVILKPLDDSLVQLRQMVVDDRCRNCGLGRELIRAVEADAQTRGIRKITMSARYEVREFYEKQGYNAVGAVFQTHGIEHVQMEKTVLFHRTIDDRTIQASKDRD
jgi:predicted GNAT family N-acyltransferase